MAREAALKKKKKEEEQEKLRFENAVRKALEMALTKGKSFDPKYVRQLEDIGKEALMKKAKPVPKIITHPVLDPKAIAQVDSLITNYLEPAAKARDPKKLMIKDWVEGGK